MVQNRKHADAGIDRRRVLQGLTAAGAIGVAGCLWGGDGEAAIADLDAAYERQEVDVDEIQEGGTLEVAIAENIDSFDPPYSTDTTSTFAQEFMFESLITTDRDGNIYPWLAESYELVDTQDVDESDYVDYMVEIDHTEDGVPDTDEQIVIRDPDNDPSADSGNYLTVNETGDAVDDGTYGMHFRYELHEGIEFTNGEELTAEHVVRSYERYENSDLAGQVFDQFLHARAVDDYTVDLYANFPDAEAERDLHFYIFSEEQVDLPAGDLDPRQGNVPIGTGPYVFEEFEDESHYVVTRNEDYWFSTDMKDEVDLPDGWPDGPVIDEIDMTIVPDDSARSAAIQNDEVDLTYSLAGDAMLDFQDSDDYRVTATPGGSYTFMQFPVQVEPWDNQEVRRAVNHLIPREQIVNNIFAGWAEEAWAPLPEMAAEFGTTDYEQLLEDLREYNEYDPDRAEELIEEAGVDTPIEVTLETNADNSDRVRMVELIADSMEQTGLFETTLSTYEWTTYITRILNPEYYQEGALTVIGLSGTFNPHSFCQATHHPDQFAECCNFQNVDFPELTEKMDEALYGMEVLDDEEERASRYDEIWELVQEINANSYLELGVEHLVTSDDVVGMNAYPFSEGYLDYGLYNPFDQQITYLDR